MAIAEYVCGSQGNFVHEEIKALDVAFVSFAFREAWFRLTSGDLLLTQEGYTIQAALHETLNVKLHMRLSSQITIPLCQVSEGHADWSRKLVAYR